jgi:carbonic anhydrase/acetyltransferase-like protein (isoleucine patch superfamily)
MPLYALGDHRPHIEDPARFWAAPDAQIMGHVLFGPDSSVWFGAVLRGDNEPIRVGARTNIQEHSMLHTDPGAPLTLGEEVTVGHHAIVHGCTIGDRCLVGINSTILNRAVIGEDCLIGAHALITENKEIPPRSLVLGSPAKVVRELSEDELAMLRASADVYVKNAERFRAELSVVEIPG